MGFEGSSVTESVGHKQKKSKMIIGVAIAINALVSGEDRVSIEWRTFSDQ